MVHRRICADPRCRQSFEVVTNTGKRGRPPKYCSTQCAKRTAVRNYYRRRRSGTMVVHLHLPVSTVAVLEKAFGAGWTESLSLKLNSVADELVPVRDGDIDYELDESDFV
jgi:hypothetical protein